MNKINNKLYIIIIIALSLVIEGALFWIVYGKTPHNPTHSLVPYLPWMSASFNLLSALMLYMAKRAIKNVNIKAHVGYVLTSLGFSALFLFSYLSYHWLVGRTYFGLEGFAKIFILSLLIVHVLVSMVNLPMILTTLFYALSGQYFKHRRLAKYTFYAWQFVSISGVIIIVLPKIYS